MEIFKTFTIDAAHHLPDVPAGHKCGRLHGHTFTIEIHACGEVGNKSGWVVDFADIAKAFASIHNRLDHSYLNEIEGLGNPTSENIARWIWAHLKPELPLLSRIMIKETPNVGCCYEGD
jgi:6-pyruvoyltetrahydropterin/6-carboxytetrahydropterin synthase